MGWWILSLVACSSFESEPACEPSVVETDGEYRVDLGPGAVDDGEDFSGFDAARCCVPGAVVRGTAGIGWFSIDVRGVLSGTDICEFDYTWELENRLTVAPSVDSTRRLRPS